MLDAGAHGGALGIGTGRALGHRLALWLFAMDAADPAIAFNHVSLAWLRYAVSAQTSEAVLSRVTTSRSIRPSKRAPSVTSANRMNP